MISNHSPLILGSASPRRLDILRGLGIALRVEPANVPEERRADEAPEAYLERVVQDKLQAVAARCAGLPCAAILVADTSVVLDGDVLGKPADVAEAEQLLSRLCGRAHQVFTRYAIAVGAANARAAVEHSVESRVFLRAASLQEIRAYARTGEGLDKAGAYAAQGIGAFLVQRIEGSYSNVVGLPACEVVLDLVQLGLLSDFPVAFAGAQPG